jgi:hypothetical protein
MICLFFVFALGTSTSHAVAFAIVYVLRFWEFLLVVGKVLAAVSWLLIK